MNTSTWFGGLVIEIGQSPFVASSPVLKPKFVQTPYLYYAMLLCTGVGNKNSYPFPYNSESLFVGVGDK